MIRWYCPVGNNSNQKVHLFISERGHPHMVYKRRVSYLKRSALRMHAMGQKHNPEKKTEVVQVKTNLF